MEESATRRGNLDSREVDPDRVSSQNLVGPTEGGNNPCSGEAASHRDRAALCRPWTPDIEKLLRDTPEPGTPLVRSLTPERTLTPGATRIPIEAAKKPAEDMDAVVDRLQVVVKGLLPWLKDDISSSESSNPRTPSPDIELEDIFEFEESAQKDPDPEQLNKISKVEEGAKIVPKQEQLNNGFPERKSLRVAYRSFLDTRQRIAVIEGLGAYNQLDLILPRDVFEPNTGPIQAQAELDMLAVTSELGRESVYSS